MSTANPVGGGALEGRRIVVTRSRRQASALSEGLRRRGAEAIEIPTIEVVAPASWEPFDQALFQLASYDWLILTSANTVRILGERLAVLGLESDTLMQVKIAVVGASTAAALGSIGAQAAVVPAEYVAESLVEVMGTEVGGRRILLLQAAIARDVLRDQLTGLGAIVEVVEAYRTILAEDSLASVRSLFADKEPVDVDSEEVNPGEVDAVTFTSSSTVENFAALLSRADVSLPRHIAAISIGPITSATLRGLGWEAAAEADPHDIPGLIEATIRAVASRLTSK